MLELLQVVTNDLIGILLGEGESSVLIFFISLPG